MRSVVVDMQSASSDLQHEVCATTPTTSTTAASKWYAACSVPYAIGRGHTVCVIGCAS